MTGLTRDAIASRFSVIGGEISTGRAKFWIGAAPRAVVADRALRSARGRIVRREGAHGARRTQVRTTLKAAWHAARLRRPLPWGANPSDRSRRKDRRATLARFVVPKRAHICPRYRSERWPRFVGNSGAQLSSVAHKGRPLQIEGGAFDKEPST